MLQVDRGLAAPSQSPRPMPTKTPNNPAQSFDVSDADLEAAEIDPTKQEPGWRLMLAITPCCLRFCKPVHGG